MSPLVLAEVEIETVHQRREHVSHFVKTYRKVTCHDPSDDEIARHIECHEQLRAVSWVSPNDYHKADVLARKGI